MAKIINSQEFDNTIESGVVVVDFFATWCGPCKMLSPVIDELSGELENVNFVKVDIDQSMDLAQKFKIVSVPTLKVFKNGEEVFLTSVEYKLLLILIQNKNTVLSRSKILEKLWDVTYDFVNDNTLTVYIKRLREKIEDNSADPKYILTVRGMGYKWNGSENNVSI